LVLANPDFRARFQREIQSLTRLSHPHIVQVYDAGEHEGLPFAVLQYLPHGTLEQQRPRDHAGQICPLPIEHLAGWLPDIADALDYVHSQGCVHRDVKPANILFQLGRAYLSDFGLAKVTAGDGRQWRTVTQAGVLGTPPYMARRSTRAWSSSPVRTSTASVMVYELLAGRLPFDVPTAQAMLLKQEAEPVPELRAVCPTVPQALADAVARGMAKQAADRFPDCVSLAQAVLGLSGSTKRIATAAATSPGSTSSAGVAPTRLEPSPAVRAGIPATQALHPAAAPGSGPQQQVAERLPRSQPRGRKSGVRTIVFLTLIGAGISTLLIVITHRSANREVAADRQAATNSPPPAKSVLAEGTRGEVQSAEGAMPAVPAEAVPTALASVKDDHYVPKPVKMLPTITNSIGTTLALIPAGEFLMGSPDSDRETYGNERSQHPVRITKPFYLGVFDVTQADYQEVTGGGFLRRLLGRFVTKDQGDQTCDDRGLGQQNRRVHPIAQLDGTSSPHQGPPLPESEHVCSPRGGNGGRSGQRLAGAFLDELAFQRRCGVALSPRGTSFPSQSSQDSIGCRQRLSQNRG
jgi:hypothetical protein